MKEESSEDKRIRLMQYEAIRAGEKAGQKVVERSSLSNIPQNEYMRVFWEAYLKKMEELKKQNEEIAL